jgi:hypothetical protein
MKPLFLAIIIIFLAISCNNKKSNMLSESEISTIQNEVKKEIDLLITGCESLDMDMAFKVFTREPGFFMIASDGRDYDFQSFFNNNKDYLDTCIKFELFTRKLDIKVLTSDLVVVSWLYKAVATMKEGNQDIFENAGATFLFKKIYDEWVVINYQESTLPPERINS